MVSIARKNLFAERTRLLISVGGVAFSILLVLILTGVYSGMMRLSSAYIDHTEADLWVAQAGTKDMFHSASVLPLSATSSITKVSGVKEVTPLSARSMVFKVRGEEKGNFISGFDPKTGLAGPWKMIQGSSKIGDNEIVIDKVFASKNNLKIGDNVEILGQKLTVKGISDETNKFLYQQSFLTQRKVTEITGLNGLVSYFLVNVTDPSQKSQIASDIEKKVPGTKVFLKEEFAKENGRMIEESFVPIILVLVLIGVITGAAVIGLTIYTATLEKIKEYGILKAIGASNGYLYRVIFEQALVTSVIGFLFGVGFSFVVKELIDYFRPEVPVSLEPTYILAAGGAALLMSLVASYIPIHKVAKVDPATVFRG